MKKLFFIFSGVLVFGCMLLSCNKRVNPALTAKHMDIGYDSTAFDYVFTEAIKEKFLGNAGDALKYLEQCVKINPESDAAYYEMAQIAIMLSDQKNGKKFGLKAVSINEMNIWYLLLVANIYEFEKKTDSAILFYEKAVKFFPENENVKLNLANAYTEKGLFDKSTAIYNYFETKYGASETVSLALIKNLMSAGNYKLAEEKAKELLLKSPDEVMYNGLLAEIYRIEGEKEKAVEIYRKLLDQEPVNPQTLLSVSDFLISEKQYEDLFLVLNRIILNDSISRENKINLFSKMIGDTSILRQHSEDVELALIVLEADNKDDDIIVLLRPELYQVMKNFAKATARFEEIIAVSPDNYYAWERLLILYSEEKDWDNLLLRGKDCATRFNRSFPAKILYASAAIEKGQLAVAEEELRKAKILAGSDTSMIVQVLVMDADVFYRKKEFSKSFETFRVALGIKPDDIMILNNYAYYLAERGEMLKEAEKMAKLVIEKEPGNTTYLDTYAWVLYKRGRLKEARKMMDRIISLGEKPDAVWYEHMGYIMQAMKNCNKAVEYWKISIEIDSSKTALIKEIENCGKH
jgi:Tfp pilus assembly protein PilF